MEAATARYATRERFSTFGEQAQTPLQRYIQNAVDPQNFEPNLALDLEISDLINSKKGNAPREAAVAIVNYINHRNPNVSLLALTLLDICVKNCGYPFHLQISTKEFLNELVRRFPERPPLRPTRVQAKVLELIEEWRSTICQTSRYKEDLGFIRDMHRLLSYKGYVFPAVKREDASVLNPSDNLKSAEEMEEEERAAQSAKLQELIRRGAPEDLQEANRLMKVMAGYDTRHKTDYRAKAAEEVGKIQQKARLLEERLQNFKQGDKMTEGDVFEDLANSLQSAQPKIQKMCEEESDDQEAVAKLFEINDSIHRTIERYKLIKSGDIEGAHKIPQGTLGTTQGVGKNANNQLSLIDFDPEESNSNGVQSHPAPNQESLEDDLLGLSFQDQGPRQPYGQGGGIALGFGNDAGSLLPSSSTQPATMPQLSSVSSSTPIPPPAKPNYDILGAFSTSSSSSSKPTASSLSFLSQTTPQPNESLRSSAGSTSTPIRKDLPITSPNHQPPATASNFDFAAAISANPVTKPASTQNTSGAAADEDWNFSSALPEESLPSSVSLIVSEKDIRIVFEVSRRPTEEAIIDVVAHFSNTTATAITEYTFQVAVTKAFTLKLTPQSGRKMQPLQTDAITQPIEIHGVRRGQSGSVKMRWKASYKAAGDIRQEQGEVPPLAIA